MAAAAAGGGGAGEPTQPVQEEQPSQEQTQSQEKLSREGQNGTESSQSQGLDPGEDTLRNAPTFKDELAPDREEEAPEEKPKSPGFVEKTMQKLGLNDVLLKSMFKSVSPFSLPVRILNFLEPVLTIAPRFPPTEARLRPSLASLYTRHRQSCGN